MIAYCPAINACGLTKGKHTIELTEASTYEKRVKITLTGASAITSGKGESCYWEVHAPTVDKGKNTESSISMRVNKNTGVNAYAYGGDTRATATKPIHEGNVALVTGKNYYFTASDGNMITALAMSDDTDFEIEFWIMKTAGGEPAYDPKPKPSNAHLIIIIVIAVIVIVVLAGVVMKMRMAKKANDV